MSSIADNLATAVRVQLDEMGWSQATLAWMADVSEKHLSQMLNGHANASVAMWDRLFDELNDAAGRPRQIDEGRRPMKTDGDR